MSSSNTSYSTVSTSRARQYTHLNAQLAILQANMADLENLIQVSAVQAGYIQRLGVLNGSLFMAAHRVFESEADQIEDENNPNSI